MASEESRQCAAARRDPPLTQYRNELIQSKVPLLADKSENPPRILLQRGRAPSTGHWFARPIFAKALQPADRGTRADLKVFGSATSGSSCFHKLNLITRTLKSPGYGPRIGQPSSESMR
jgi:hypothetical protein